MSRAVDPAEVRERAVSALQTLVRIANVSHPDPDQDDLAAFDAVHDALAEHFPLLHSELGVRRIGRHGLLFHWSGRSHQRPVVLMAHQDVVDVDTQAPWTHPPFDAVRDQGAIWGRGTLDDKGSLVAICTAVEHLLERGFVPAQDVWLSFGADEETLGTNAQAAVAELRQRGVRPWFVLDEGGAVATQAFPGVSSPVAVIGVAEKGTTDLRLVCEGRGGHASTPSPKGPTWRIARALMRLEAHPLPATVPAPTLELLRRMAPQLPRPIAALLARADTVAPLLARALNAAGPETAAMTRTTLAATTLRGSAGRNVLATRAEAGINVRLITGDTVAQVVRHVDKVVRDPQVTVEVVRAGEPTPVSPTGDDPAFTLLRRITAHHFPQALVSPYLVTGATDSRFFTEICDRVYRFTPLQMTKSQRASVHSYDEHVKVDDLAAGVLWYRTLLERIT